VAYALVGSLGAEVSSGSGSAISGLAYGQTPTIHDLLIAWWSGCGSTTVPAASALGTGWQRDVSITVGSGTTGSAAAIYSKIAVGSDAVPSFAAISSCVQQVMLGEFSGNATTSWLDQIGSVAGSSTSPSVATCAAADAQSGELVIVAACVFRSNSGTEPSDAVTINNGTANATNNNSTSTPDHYNYPWAITTTNASADSASFAHGTSHINGCPMAVASYKLAPAGPAAPIPDVIMAPLTRPV
jgi:hypothetical protein